MDVVFDLLTIVFLTLTLLVLVIVIGVVSGAMEPPIFAPAATAVPATMLAPPTLTPSPAPDAQVTPLDDPAD